MSSVLVTGATGTLGRPLVTALRDHGHHVRTLSRRPGAGTHTGDLTTGAGLEAAAAGVQVVIHAASDARRFGRSDLDQTRHLLGVLSDADHIVYVSIVGIENMAFGYYRHKLACEREIEASGVPHTIVRATQFHELTAKILHAAERFVVAPLPVNFRFQSVAAAEVAAHVADLAVGRKPLGRAPDFGGPQVLSLGEMARIWRSVRGRPRAVVPLWVPGRFGSSFRRGVNTCPEQAVGTQTWAEFVASAVGPRN